MARLAHRHVGYDGTSDRPSSPSGDGLEDESLDHAHAVFHQLFVTEFGGQLSMNVRFRELDERRDTVHSLRDFAQVLGDLNGELDDQELQAVFDFYEVAAKGLTEFLLGLRYILQVHESELTYTCKKVRSLLAHVQPKAATPAGLTAALRSLGLGDAALTCHEFQLLVEESFAEDVTPSEAALIFSMATNRRREGATLASRLVELIVEAAFQVPRTQPLSHGALSALEVVRTVGAAVYADLGSIGSRLSLAALLRTHDRDGDGWLRPGEFRAAVAAIQLLERADEDRLLRHVVDEESGLVHIDKFLHLFSIFDYVHLEPQSVAQLVAAVRGQLRRRIERDGAATVRRLAHRCDAGGTGRLALEEFAAFLQQACDAAVTDLDCEVLFGELAQREEYLMWKPFLDSCAPRQQVPNHALAEAESEEEEDKEAEQQQQEAGQGRARRPPVPPEVEALLAFVAQQVAQQHWDALPADAVQPLRAAFQRRDRAGTGRVGPEAFRDVLREAADVLPRDADRLFRGYDAEGAGHLDYSQFLHSLVGLLVTDRLRPPLPHLPPPSSPVGPAMDPRMPAPGRPPTPPDPDDVGPPSPAALARPPTGAVLHSEAIGAMLLRDVRRAFPTAAAAHSALSRADGDGDGRLGRAEFTAALQSGGVRLTARQLDVLFDRHCQSGLLPIGPFVAALQQLLADSPAPHTSVAGELAVLQAAFSRKVGTSPAQLKAFFARYDTRHRGGLTLLEWTKAVGDCAPDVPVKVSERVHRYFTENSGEFTFEDFLICAQGPLQNDIRNAARLQDVLLAETYGGDRVNRVQGTVALARLLRFYDHHNGQLDREHFGRAMAALGLGFSRAEVDNLFLTYDFDGTGLVAIPDFVDSLRVRQHYVPPPAELQRLLKAVQDGCVDRGMPLHKPEAIVAHFQRLDPNRTRRLDLLAFTRALREVCDTHLSDFECELLFNHFSSPGLLSTDYGEFVTALTAQQAYHFRDNTTWRDSVAPAPAAEREVAVLQEALLRLFYARGRPTTGTVRLAAALHAADRDGDGRLTLPQFVDAVGRFDLAAAGLAGRDLGHVYAAWCTPEQPLLPIDTFVAAYRARADLTLQQAEFDAIVAELRQCLPDKLGHQRSQDRVQLWFEQQLPDPQLGSMDLFVFTRSVRSFCQKALDDIAIELLFHAFRPDRFGRVPVDTVVDCLVYEPPPPPTPPLSAEQIAAQLQGLGELWFDAYDLQQRPSQVRYVLTRFNVEDRDGDGHVTLREFQRALRTWPLAATDSELEGLFNAFQAHGLLNIGDFIRAVRGYQRPAIQSAADLDRVLAHLRQAVGHQGYAGDRTVLRVFERFDTDGDGRLDYDAFERALRQTLGQVERPLTPHDIQLLFQTFDTDRRGSVDFQAFLHRVGWGAGAAHRPQSPPQPRPAPPPPSHRPQARPYAAAGAAAVQH